MKMLWKRQTAAYSNGEDLFLGKWKVGGYHWDSISSKENEKKYKPTCLLPGIKPSFDNCLTAEEAKEKAESVVNYWLKKAKEDL